MLPKVSKKTFMCPNFLYQSVLKYTKCHISTYLSNFLKLPFIVLPKLICPCSQQIANQLKKIGLVGTLHKSSVGQPTPLSITVRFYVHSFLLCSYFYPVLQDNCKIPKRCCKENLAIFFRFNF